MIKNNNLNKKDQLKINICQIKSMICQINLKNQIKLKNNQVVYKIMIEKNKRNNKNKINYYHQTTQPQNGNAWARSTRTTAQSYQWPHMLIF